MSKSLRVEFIREVMDVWCLPGLSLTRNHRWIANLDSHNTAMPLSATASLKSYSAPQILLMGPWILERVMP